MTFLKTHANHGCFRTIFYYLHYGRKMQRAIINGQPCPRRRDLGIDTRGVSNIVDATQPELERWCDQMQDTYNLYTATHKKPARGKPRTYYHFIVSPNPNDNASLEQIRGLCNTWLDKNFPEFEAAIIYHNDNAEREARGLSGIIHGHIIVNSITLDGNHKLQLSNRQIDALTDQIQKLAPTFGLSAFAPDPKREYKRAKHSATRHSTPQRCGTERAIAARDAQSWKQDMRDIVASTIPFCTDFEDLRRHLAPYGYGAERIKGGLLFIDPTGHKAGSNHLGIDFTEYKIQRFFRKNSFTRLNNARYPNLTSEIREKHRALQRTNPELLRLQETLDALSTIKREQISSVGDFALRRAQLKEFASGNRVKFFGQHKYLESINDTFKDALTLMEHHDLYKLYTSAPPGPDKAALFTAHEREIAAYQKAYKSLQASERTPDEIRKIVKQYRPLATQYLNIQATMDGIAERLEDIKRAQYVIRKIQSACILRENEERLAMGMPPIKPPATKIKAPPAVYKNSKQTPYWNINIRKATYKRIKATNQAARANLARSAPDKHMPPYMDRRKNIAHSIEVQHPNIHKITETKKRHDDNLQI